MIARNLVYLSVFLLVAMAASSATDSTQWETQLDSKVWLLTPTCEQTMIACTDDSLIGINIESGSVTWSALAQPGFFAFHATAVPHTPHVLLALFVPDTSSEGRKKARQGQIEGHLHQLWLVDTRDGSRPWTSEELGAETCLGYFMYPCSTAVLAAFEDRKGRPFMASIDIIRGKLSWRNDSFFDGQDVWTRKLPDKRRTIYGTQPPVRDTDSTFIECMGNRYIRKSHLRTGRQLWESPVKLKTAPALYDAYPPLLLNADSSRLYIADKGKIHAISTVTGESVWAKEPKLKRPVLDYTLTDAGLLVMIGRQSAPGKRSDPEVLLLSADTGEDIWHETARDMSIEDLTNLAADGDRAWVYSRKRLFGIGLTDGAIVEIANDVDFRGAGEKPLILTAHDGSFWLRSAENVMEVDESGTIVHHAHYPGQQISDLEFIGKFLAGAAIQLTLGQVFTGAWQWDWIFEGSLPIKARYIQQVDNRFTSHYVVSRNPEVAQLTEIVRLDRGTFRETGRARLTTKVDVLSIDEDRSLVVFVHDDTHLMCTRFLAP